MSLGRAVSAVGWRAEWVEVSTGQGKGLGGELVRAVVGRGHKAEPLGDGEGVLWLV